MNFEVIPSKKFKKEAKRLIKKYASLKSELNELAEILSQNPETGKPLGNNVFKIRLAIKAKGKGKSGGSRVITYIVNEHREVYLPTYYI
jgi:mRNA-degrading endonuclease RelE of RelBE toxin-antitoxin system